MSANNICVCAKALSKTFTKKGYSNIVLDNVLSNINCDKPFCTALYYGVIERKITVDYIISQYSSKPIEKIDAMVLQVMRCGVYMLKFMNTPQNIAVNDSVEAVRQIGFTSAKGFVNAVLRSFLRANLDFPVPMDELISFSILYSTPVWLVQKWRHEYPDDFISILQSTVESPKTTIRLNTAKFDKNDILRSLDADKIAYTQSQLLSDCLHIEKGDLFKSQSFEKGMFYVQDISSQLCAAALGAFQGSTVIDVCAAPGGKSFTIAQYMNDNGTVYSCDLHEKRVKLISDGAERLHLESIKSMQNDVLKHNDNLPMADFVICDAVCSGLGVISKKPEIKYKNPDELKGLPDIQKRILNCSKDYVKSGGVLLYSTCTLSIDENENVANAFLAENSDFVGEPFLQDLGEPFGNYCATILPKHFASDGFFIAKFRRK